MSEKLSSGAKKKSMPEKRTTTLTDDCRLFIGYRMDCDVKLAKLVTSEIYCIAEVEKVAEMYSYSSKRVDIIFIHTLDV